MVLRLSVTRRCLLKRSWEAAEHWETCSLLFLVLRQTSSLSFFACLFFFVLEKWCQAIAHFLLQLLLPSTFALVSSEHLSVQTQACYCILMCVCYKVIKIKDQLTWIIHTNSHNFTIKEKPKPLTQKIIIPFHPPNTHLLEFIWENLQ